MRKLLFLVTLGVLMASSRELVAQGADMTTKPNIIIFVHGLMGDSKATWTNTKSNSYWPDLIASDPAFTSFDVESYDYPATFFQRGQSLNELASQFAEHLAQVSRQHENIFLVGHSFGGVISVDAAMKMSVTDPGAFEKVRGIFLLGSPFRGTPNVTKSLRYLAPSLIFEELKEININSYLQALDSNWRALMRAREGRPTPNVFVAFETSPTRLGFFIRRLIVDRNSLFPYSIDDPYPAIGNHYAIVKPSNTQASVYQWVGRRIHRILEGYSPVAVNDMGLNLRQSAYHFDTQSNISEATFSATHLPSVRIFTEKPYATFNCFDFEDFRLIRKTKDELVFSNEASNPAVVFRFHFLRSTGNIVIDFEDMAPNDKKSTSYANRLDFLRFQRALMSNARIVFWDIKKDALLFRTGPTLPTNLVLDERAVAIEGLLQKIVRIERAFQVQIKFHRQYTRNDLKVIGYVDEVLAGKEILTGNPFRLELRNEEEKQTFLKRLTPENYVGDYKHHFGFEHEEIVLLGTKLDLGQWTLKVPEAEFDPPPDVLRQRLTQAGPPLTVTIKARTNKPPMAVWHYRQAMRHDLPPAIDAD